MLRKTTPQYIAYGVHDTLDRITSIIKRDIFCIVKISLIFFPKTLKLFAGANLGDNIRIEVENFLTASLIGCALQGLKQCL